LQLGAVLGSGGEGEVRVVENRPGAVFKRYFRPNASAAALRAMAAFPGTLAPEARHVLDTSAAWPLACVSDGTEAVGFLMNRVPRQFTATTTARTKLRELQYLLYAPRPMWGEIVPPDAAGRIDIARAFVSLMRTLQDNSVVLGDISMANLLWSAGKPGRIFLIDCDSALLPGQPPVSAKAAQTPGWDDPLAPPAGLDLDTDRYKVALVVGRILAGDAEVRPGGQLAVLRDVPANIAGPVRDCFADSGGAHGTRPPLTRWAQALSGREMLPLLPPAPLPPVPAVPFAEIDRRGPRESIRLSPFGSGAHQQPPSPTA
jgi:hypothetical protein